MNTTLVNATPFDVEYLDEKKETIHIYKLSVRQLYTWAKLMRDREEPALVAFCAGKPLEWVDTLEEGCFADLVVKCVELNLPRAMAIAKKAPAMANLIGPMTAEAVVFLRGAVEATRGLNSNASLPAPAPSGSAGASGSASSTSLPSD